MLNLEIVTPEKIIFSDEVALVVVPGAEGEFGVLPNHTPIIAQLKAGQVRVFDKADGGKAIHEFAIEGGFAQVVGNKCTILSDKISAEAA